MSSHELKASAGGFVIFRAHHYAGFWRRLVIVLVDSTLVFLLVVLTVAVASVVVWGAPSGIGVASAVLPALLALLVSFLYLGVLKRSAFRTVGYRLAGCEVLSVSGRRPTLRAMAVRFMLWLFVNPVVNLLSMSQEATRQTIADQVAGTLVVRRGCRPVTELGVCHRVLFFMRSTFIVVCPKQPKRSDSAVEEGDRTCERTAGDIERTMEGMMRRVVGTVFVVLVACQVTAAPIEVAEDWYSLEVPSGWQRAPSMLNDPSFVHAYSSGDLSTGEPEMALVVEVLNGTINRDKIPADKMPAGASVSTMQWGQRELEVLRIPEVVEGRRLVNRNVMVPLEPRAIQLRMVGDESLDDEMRATLQRILQSVEGDTNWVDSEERAESLGTVFGVLVVAAVGFYLWRRQRG